MAKKGVIFLVDMQSFYASVEKAKNKAYADKPLVVSGDPKRRSGVILAACPLAKKFGVKNAERLWEAQQKCPEAIVVKPHMQDYIDVSMQITAILKRFSDLVEPYSIDEQFLDMTHSYHLFGKTPEDSARRIQEAIMRETGVRARVGWGENKILAKLSCDNFAKKNESGIHELRKDNLANSLWKLPVEDMFGVGSKMKHHLYGRGIRTIGHIANLEMMYFKKRWGVHGQVLWMTANGEDFSPVKTSTHDGQKAIGHGMTLPRDYTTENDAKIILLELCEEVCTRSRRTGVMGNTVNVSVSGGAWESPQGFSRQLKMGKETNITMELYKFACELFDKFWSGYPIRRIGVSLNKLETDKEVQLSLFDDKATTQRNEKAHILGYVMDAINQKYGKATLTRATTLLEASQVRERTEKIGGHYK